MTCTTCGNPIRGSTTVPSTTAHVQWCACEKPKPVAEVVSSNTTQGPSST